MITSPCQIKAASIIEVLEILAVIAFGTLISVDSESRNRFGSFYVVTLGFLSLFALCSIRVIMMKREMQAKSYAIESIRFASQSDQLYDGGQTGMLNQQFATTFKNHYGLVILTKTIISFLFEACFNWAY